MNELRDDAFLAMLRERFNAGERFKYVFFWGHQSAGNTVTAACFSQWFPAPFTLDGDTYPTAEHFMMAEKAALFGDEDTRARILRTSNPGAAKALGREVRGFDETLWAQQRFAIVVRANRAKFEQNRELGKFLAATQSRVLVEASPVDRIWGIGLAQDDVNASDPNHWRGLNLLGFALMKVRDG